MTKSFILIIVSSLFLFACSPDESEFKSNVPPISERSALLPEESNALPNQINLDLPFYPQAPDGDWGEPWKESCEEASLVLAYHGLMNKSLSKEQFKEDVLKMVEWQNEHFGSYEDTDVAQTSQLIQEFYGFFNVKIIDNPSIEDLKKELAQGHFVITPLAGRQINNPFYSGEGPNYHMLVIRGYDEKHFITNDIGTKRGENFIYPHEVIMNAIHDYHKEDINLGAKRVLILKTDEHDASSATGK